MPKAYAMKRRHSLEDLNNVVFNVLPLCSSQQCKDPTAPTASQPRAKRSCRKQRVTNSQSELVDNSPIHHADPMADCENLCPDKSRQFSYDPDLISEIKSQRQAIRALEDRIGILLTKVDTICNFMGITRSSPNTQVQQSLAHVSVAVSVDQGIDSHQPVGTVEVQPNHDNDSSAPPDAVVGVDGAAAPLASEPIQGAMNNIQPPQLTITDVFLKAVHNDNADRERRSKNIIISGLKENDGEDDMTQAAYLLRSEIGTDISDFKCKRLGRRATNKGRLLLLQFPTSHDASFILSKARNLRNSLNPWVRENVFLNGDIPLADRKAAYEARCLRRSMKRPVGPLNLEPANRHSIPIRVDRNMQSRDECDNTQSIRVVINSARRNEHAGVSTNNGGEDFRCDLADRSQFPELHRDVASEYSIQAGSDVVPGIGLSISQRHQQQIFAASTIPTSTDIADVDGRPTA